MESEAKSTEFSITGHLPGSLFFPYAGVNTFNLRIRDVAFSHKMNRLKRSEYFLTVL